MAAVSVVPNRAASGGLVRAAQLVRPQRRLTAAPQPSASSSVQRAGQQRHWAPGRRTGPRMKPQRLCRCQLAAGKPRAGAGSREGGALQRLAHWAAAPLRLLIPGAELAQRVQVTLLLIFLARLGHFIPIPGIQWQAAGGRAAMEFLMGRSKVAANVFVLGITPLITAYFVLAGLNVIPDFRKHFAALREEGPQGRDVFNSYASALFVFIACWEGFALARSWLPLRTAAAAAGQAASSATSTTAAGAAAGAVMEAAKASSAAGGMGFVLWSMVVLAAGSTICKGITQAVEQHGLGDGTGLLIALGVTVNYAHGLQSAAAQLAAAPPAPVAALLVAALCAGLVAISLWAQSVELRLPITFYRARRSAAQRQHPLLKLLASDPKQQQQQAVQALPLEALSSPDQQQQQREQGGGAAVAAKLRPEEEGKQHHFPMRLSPVGARSLLFANFWVGLLEAPLVWLGLGNPFQTALGFAALVLVIEGVTIADMTPRQMSQFLAGSDAGIHGLSPGDETMHFLAAKRQQLKLLNAALLALLSLAARAVDAASLSLIGVPAGCLSLLLLASTVASGARQVEALSRAPAIERMVAREQAAAGWHNGPRIVIPEGL